MEKKANFMIIRRKKTLRIGYLFKYGGFLELCGLLLFNVSVTTDPRLRGDLEWLAKIQQPTVYKQSSNYFSVKL